MNSPVIEFSAASTQHHPTVRNLAIKHEGADAALVFDNFIRSRTEDVKIDCLNAAPKCVDYRNDAFFAWAENNHFERFTDVGVHVRGLGFAHHFVHNHVTTTADNNPSITGLSGPAGFRIERPWAFIYGGQVDANPGTNEGIAVQFYNPQASSMQGGYVSTSVEHSDVGVDITGSSNFKDVTAENMYYNLNNVGTGIRFGNTAESYLWLPTVLSPSGGGTLDEYTTDSAKCMSFVSQDAARAPAVDGGTFNSGRFVPELLNDTFISSVDTTVDTTVLGALDHETVPAVYDASAATWKHLASATTAYTP